MQKLPPATRVELAIINSTAGRVKLVIEPAYHQPSEPLGSAYAAALGVKADQSPTPKVLTVAEVMQNPKLAEALAKLKECPFMYQELVAHDPELQSLFEQLERAVAAKEAEKQAEKQAPAKKAGAGGVHPATIARMEGGAAFKAGDYARAAARFATAIAHGGKNPQFLHANRSAALSACGRYAEALEAADAAVARDASYYKAHYRRGVALASMGRWEEAEEACEEALRKPGSSENDDLIELLDEAKERRVRAEARAAKGPGHPPPAKLPPPGMFSTKRGALVSSTASVG